jgi:hypothetical protein
MSAATRRIDAETAEFTAARSPLLMAIRNSRSAASMRIVFCSWSERILLTLSRVALACSRSASARLVSSELAVTNTVPIVPTWVSTTSSAASARILSRRLRIREGLPLS